MIPVFVMLVVSAGAAGVGSAEDVAAEKIEELGGRVERNRDKPGNPVEMVEFFRSKGGG